MKKKQPKVKSPKPALPKLEENTGGGADIAPAPPGTPKPSQPQPKIPG